MDFKASLDYLYGLQHFGIKLGLSNMRALNRRLSLMRSPVPCIHVAGTNGKGSVCGFIAEILKQSNLRTGLYTSPHLHCITERICINGEPLARDAFARLASKIHCSSKDIPLTFFEATTAMALLAFQENNVDIAVIETGLGGRLDATNVIQPMVCVLTPISYDHCEHLGESLFQISTEKAGILKKKTPVVVGKQEPEVLGVIQNRADALKSRVCLAGKDYSWQGSHDNLSVEIKGERLKVLSCCLAGTHQLDNFSQAVATAVEIRHHGFSIPDDAIRKAGKAVFCPGRLEWLGNKQKVLLDVSHNEAGTRTLCDYLSDNSFENIYLVVGMSGDRKPKDILDPLKPLVAKVFAVPVPHSSGVSTHLIADWAKQVGLPCEEFGSAETGLKRAIRSSGADENVVVCGSIYLVAELRNKLLQEPYHSLIG